jgi:hypothetical protein
MQPDDDQVMGDTQGVNPKDEQSVSGNRGGRYSKHRMLHVPRQVVGLTLEPGAEVFAGHGETCVLRGE